ncbi:MAG: nascent polypeptide-associated complex protein [Candidatus Marsarchaeota archaeon]|nr:nascent polypeptide-associated complex protein [Candidatus Marsarchaeota archaeon]
MMPNIDPRTLKSMMAKMGMKSTDINANSVTIECPDKLILISNPQVMKVETQGIVTFQISGEVSESDKAAQPAEINEDDIKLVMEKSGIGDADKAREALEKSNGDIAQAILELTGNGQ